jgi:hypothetical protein
LLPLGSPKCAMHRARDVHLAGSLIHASPHKFGLQNCIQTICANIRKKINVFPQRQCLCQCNCVAVG